MKKIIAAFDGLKYAESTKAYAVSFAAKTNTHLVGVFMDDAFYTSYQVYNLLVKEDVPQGKLKEYAAKDQATRDAAAADFKQVCEGAKLEFSIHHDHSIAMQELKHESIYADLLIISAHETLTRYTEKLPTRFIRDLLSDTQCPVIAVPKKFNPVTKVILLYDGKPSSVYAIKMFSYLLPQLKHLFTEVIVVNSVTEGLHIPDNKLMKEFMKRHYPKAKYTTLKGIAEDEIVAHLKHEEEHALVVLGAYRRGTVSRWFRESMADVLMKKVKLPLFIAHNR
jgi:nucleotide-binding universal stress UspA family protein